MPAVILFSTLIGIGAFVYTLGQSDFAACAASGCASQSEFGAFLVMFGFVGLAISLNRMPSSSRPIQPEVEPESDPEPEPEPEPEPKLQTSYRSSYVGRQGLLGKVEKFEKVSPAAPEPEPEPEPETESAESRGKGFYYLLCALLIMLAFGLIEDRSPWGIPLFLVGLLSTLFVVIYNPESPEMKRESTAVIKNILLFLWWFGGPPLILAALTITFEAVAFAYLIPIYYGWILWVGRGGGGPTDSGGVDSSNY